MKRTRRCSRASILALLVAGASTVVAHSPAVAGESGMRDLAGLIAATPAGGTLRLAPGRYRGPVVIDKALTIRGPGDDARRRGAVASIEGTGQGTVVEVAHPDVRLIGLRVSGSGDNLAHSDSAVRVTAERFRMSGCVVEDALFGVHLRKAHGSVIEHSLVRGKDVAFTLRGDGIHVYESNGVTVRANETVAARDMIAFFSKDVLIEGNTVRGGRYGLHLMYSDGAKVRGNRLLANATGLYVMYSHAVSVTDNILAEANGPSGYGLAAKESDITAVTGNRMVANRVGLFLDGSPFTGTIHTTYRRNVLAYNTIGVLFQPSVRNNILTENALIDNQHPVSTTTSGAIEGNDWTAGGRGNYWSDYAGYDAAGDGIGDLAYRADRLSDALSARHPELQFFVETPAARILDAAARAFPVLRPEPLLVDTAPLVRPPHIPSAGLERNASRRALGAISALLVAIPALAVTRVRRMARRSLRAGVAA